MQGQRCTEKREKKPGKKGDILMQGQREPHLKEEKKEDRAHRGTPRSLYPANPQTTHKQPTNRANPQTSQTKLDRSEEKNKLPFTLECVLFAAFHLRLKMFFF